MDVIDWPDSWQTARFELRLVPNTRTFRSPYSSTTQVLDLGGEVWRASLTTVPVMTRDGRAQAVEAFVDRLAGGVNLLRLWHRWNESPRGTFSAAPVAWAVTDGGSAWPITNSGSAWPITDGTPALREAVEPGARTCVISSRPGRTALAGDLVGIAGELKRVLVDATADASGRLTLTFAPRARKAWPAYAASIVTTRPTANFQLQGDVPTTWAPGLVTGATLELIEKPDD